MITVLEKPIPFNGGLSLKPNKSMSLEAGLSTVPIPELLYVPLLQHVGLMPVALVDVGDQVEKGQLIAEAKANISASVHAPSSGVVKAITDHVLPNPSASVSRCIVIQTDGNDHWCADRQSITDYQTANPVELQEHIRRAGIVGLGGAGFPSSVKLIPGLTLDIGLLIINAAECEPYISCDETVIRNYVEEFIIGVDILAHALQVDECVIAIEDNKREVIEIVDAALAQHRDKDIQLKQISSLYPAGGEKQLIKSITGIDVPADGLPVDIGVVTYNVNTALAAKRAVIDAEPLIKRIVTVTGKGIRQPCNVEALIGTPIKDIVAHCGGYQDDFAYMIIGGPMMGYRLLDDSAPLIKKTNCLLSVTTEESISDQEASPCIRCDECAQVCPAGLQPQQLHWHSKKYNAKRLTDFRLFDCIECGCCSFVCPSHIPLVEQYRLSKHKIWNDRRAAMEAEQLQHRYLKKRDRELSANKKTKKPTQADIPDVNALESDKAAKQQLIADAVERVKQKRLQNSKRNSD